MQKDIYKHIALMGLILMALCLMFVSPRIPQPLSYHDFADKRTFFNIPNAFNVLSNLVYIFVGFLGVYKVNRGEAGIRFISSQERKMYSLFFLSVALGGIGSAYYHWYPNNFTFFWKRLPFAISSMCLPAAIISERINVRLGFMLFIPLVVIGVSSVVVWELTELNGHGDLRFCIFSQTLSSLILAIYWLYPYWLYPSQKSKVSSFIWIFIWLGLARVAESFDKDIFNLTYQSVSGHTLNHILSSLAVYSILNYIRERRA